MPIQQSLMKTLMATLLTIAAAIPFLLCLNYFFTECSSQSFPEPLYKTSITELNFGNLLKTQTEKDTICRLGIHHSLIFVNVVFFFCIICCFHIIGCITGNHFLLDLYWVFANNLCCVYYYFHEDATNANKTRSNIILVIMAIWSVRLTHSYLRREEYCIGHKHDWRFDMLQKKNPKFWQLTSFFIVYANQHPMIIGQSLPFWAVHVGKSAATPFGSWTDLIGIFLAILGLIIAYFADTQLFNFMQENEKRKDKIKILYRGLWKYSRHPNYFGENLYWFGLSLMAVNTGESWVFLGPALNFIVQIISINFIEVRMLESEKRAQAFKEYCKVTSYFMQMPPLGKLNAEHYTEISKTK